MKLSVRLFAAAREAASAERVEIELPAGAKVDDVRVALAAAAPALAPLIDRSLLAVNAEYVDIQTQLNADDELTLIPPVSGG